MKRFFTSLALALALTAAPALAAPIYIDGQHTGLDTVVQDGTTYVGLRQFVSHLRPDAAVTWEDGQAAVRAVGLTVTAVPGDLHIEANDRALYAAAGVRLEPGRTWVPVRALSAALDAEVDWDAATGRAAMRSTTRTRCTGSPASSPLRAAGSLWPARSPWATW